MQSWIWGLCIMHMRAMCSDFTLAAGTKETRFLNFFTKCKLYGYTQFEYGKGDATMCSVCESCVWLRRYDMKTFLGHGHKMGYLK